MQSESERHGDIVLQIVSRSIQGNVRQCHCNHSLPLRLDTARKETQGSVCLCSLAVYIYRQYLLVLNRDTTTFSCERDKVNRQKDVFEYGAQQRSPSSTATTCTWNVHVKQFSS